MRTDDQENPLACTGRRRKYTDFSGDGRCVCRGHNGAKNSGMNGYLAKSLDSNRLPHEIGKYVYKRVEIGN